MPDKSIASKIRSELEQYLLDYLILLSFAVATVSLLSIFRGQKQAQFAALFLFVVFYILWGFMHHIRDQTFHAKVMLEYVLIGTMVLLFMYTFI